MINKTRTSELRPFSGLTPEVVLDAAAAFGLDPDGRLFALNSYENRVYQLGAGDGQLVVKFYRPGRWSDTQIAEEHQFTAELAAAELAGANLENAFFDVATYLSHTAVSTRAQGAFVGIWFAGLALPVWLVAKVGVVV